MLASIVKVSLSDKFFKIQINHMLSLEYIGKKGKTNK